MKQAAFFCFTKLFQQSQCFTSIFDGLVCISCLSCLTSVKQSIYLMVWTGAKQSSLRMVCMESTPLYQHRLLILFALVNCTFMDDSKNTRNLQQNIFSAATSEANYMRQNKKTQKDVSVNFIRLCFCKNIFLNIKCIFDMTLNWDGRQNYLFDRLIYCLSWMLFSLMELKCSS